MNYYSRPKEKINLTHKHQFTALGGFGVGYLELITLIMCPLYCNPEDIGLASGFLGSAKQVAGTIASKSPHCIYIIATLTFISRHLRCYSRQSHRYHPA